jgi:hypothetical protein
MCTGLRNWTEMERHFLIKSREGAVPKWWKNRMGRPLSSSQTHRKKKKRLFECGETSKKKLLNAGGGNQQLKKAAQLFQN